MKILTPDDFEAIKTDKRCEVKQLKTGEILHYPEFNAHFQGLYKTTTQPYCKLREEAEAAKQILDRMIKATGLSLEHFQALNVLLSLEFSKDCTPLMNALGEAIELDSRRIDNASEELERFKASMIERAKQMASDIYKKSLIEYFVYDDELLGILAGRIENDIEHRFLPCEDCTFNKVIKEYHGLYSEELKTELAGLCARFGYIESFKEMFEEPLNKRFDLARIGGDHSFMSAAVESGQTEIVAFLIEKGADVNQTFKNGGTPLSWAACEGHTEIVAILIQNGAHVNWADRFKILIPLLTWSSTDDVDSRDERRPPAP